MGVRLRQPFMSGPAALTPSELRIASLAATGLTDRDIAQELCVTVKAIEWTLRNAFRKLGVSRRSQLAEVLTTTRRHGPEPAATARHSA